MRKTKIVCTIGPACEDEGTIRRMCLAGMDVARLNFSHGNHEEHLARINTIKKVRNELGLPIAIMLDTKGPEYRIGTFRDGPVELREGELFTLTTDKVEGDVKRVSVSDEMLLRELFPGDTVLLSDGMLALRVKEIEGSEIICRVENGGELSDRKSMSFPGKVFSKPYMSEQDRLDIIFGIENDVDFIACSFVSRREDLEDVQAVLDANGGEGIELIAKIENQSGIDNIDEICEACDGMMVARGDLGVEIAFEKLPGIQKLLIRKSRLLGKRVIIATEMLESMRTNPRPTRAEISDVANAVYDGTSAIMLSGETAAGKYPVESVATMEKIAVTTEQNIRYAQRFLNASFEIESTADAISHASCGMAIDIGASAIVVCTISGRTANMVSRFRPPVGIIGFTSEEKTWRKLALSWGVTPVLSRLYCSSEVLFYEAARAAKENFELAEGEKVVITGGTIAASPGNTNIIKIETIL